MRNKFFYLVVAMIVALPMSFADENEPEVEIQLFEVVGAGFIGGESPLGGPFDEGHIPPQPTDFHATITGHTLSVRVFNTHTTYMLVRDDSNNIVCSRQFVGYTSEQLSSGSYSLELISIGVSYLGEFDVE